MAMADKLKGLDVAYIDGVFAKLGSNTGGLDVVSIDGPFHGEGGGSTPPPAPSSGIQRTYPGMQRVFPGIVRRVPL